VLNRNAVRHGREFVKHVVPAVVKPARTVWNQVIGFVFFSFSVWFGAGTIRYGRELYAGQAQSPVAFMLAAFCFLVTFGFGFSSFLKARRIARS
jgi:hypothetical protein